MDLEEMRDTLNLANQQLSNADRLAARLAEMLVGRLKHCDHYELSKLKRELREFNMHTGKWQ